MFRPRVLTAAALILVAGLAAAADRPSNAPREPAVESSAQSALPAHVQTPPSAHAGPASTSDRPRNPRVLFIVAKDCPRCDAELARLRKAGGDFEAMQARGWKIGEAADCHLQIVAADTIAELVENLEVREFPTVACVDDSQIVRSFKSGCTTPLDAWTFGFLLKGSDERPPGMVSEKARVETTGHYPLRGNHWSIDEDWNPTRDKTLKHLRGPVHGPQIKVSWAIETWSHEELRSLHDNLHEQEMGGISGGNRSQPANQFSASRKVGGK